MTQRYRKRPLVIEAVQWTGDNADELEAFCGRNLGWWDPAMVTVSHKSKKVPLIWNSKEFQQFYVQDGHWVIRGIAGEFYPCDPDVFAQTYEAVA